MLKRQRFETFTGIATKTTRDITASIQSQTPDANPGQQEEEASENEPEAIAV